MVGPLRRAAEEANANLLKEALLENLALEKAAEPVEVELLPTEGSPRQIKAIVDSLDWKKIKPALPASDAIEEAVRATISELLLDKETPPLMKLKVLNSTFKNLGDMYKALVAAKAKQLEKPAQVNVQTNVSTGGYVVNRARSSEPSKAPGTKKEPASPPPSSDSTPDATSHPASEEPPEDEDF